MASPQIAPSDPHRVLTDGCGLIDRSQRGKLALTGLDAAEFLNGQVTNDITALRAGRGCYAAFLTHKGKMLGDLRVLAVERDERAPEGQGALLLDTERVALQALFDMIRRSKVGHAVELHKRTLERGLLSLSGPCAREVAEKAMETPLDLPATEHANRPTRIASADVLLIVSDVGVDVLMDAGDRDAVASALADHGAQPVSEAAAEVQRVQSGRPRYGVDLDDSTIPQEAGLNERAISFTKGCYVGQETVARLFYRGKPNRHLRGLLLQASVPVGGELRLAGRPVGRLSSSVVSPELGPIGLALVRREVGPGDEVTVHPAGDEVGAAPVRARVCTLPFTP